MLDEGNTTENFPKFNIFHLQCLILIRDAHQCYHDYFEMCVAAMDEPLPIVMLP
jgi:hypothetical protein